eukprot:1014866-Prymnesium_polylepis.1
MCACGAAGCRSVRSELVCDSFGASARTASRSAFRLQEPCGQRPEPRPSICASAHTPLLHVSTGACARPPAAGTRVQTSRSVI